MLNGSLILELLLVLAGGLAVGLGYEVYGWVKAAKYSRAILRRLNRLGM